MIAIDYFISSFAMIACFSLCPVNAEKKTRLLGAPQPLNLTNAESRQKVSNFVQISLNYMKNDANKSKCLENMELIRIRNATRQIVAGSIYRIDFYVGDPRCFKQSSAVPFICLDDSNYKLCSVKIFTQLWISKVPHLEEYSCQNIRKEEALGGADLMHLYYNTSERRR
uniref:Cystatin domain-containing protein n=1 Tax=Romanomermis culicivorax TaxID=13658 RepID=A0A915IIY1_ROMCU